MVHGIIFYLFILETFVKISKLPASIAFLAASLKSLTMFEISSVLSRLGGVNFAILKPLLRICGVSDLSVDDIGACPFG